MKFSKLAVFFEEIEKTSSRLEITQLLADLFKKLSPEEIEKTIYLLQGRVAPLYQATEFGVAEKTIVKSVVLALSLDKKFFENKYKEIGDLGKTVESFKKEIRSLEEKDLSIIEVFSDLDKMAHGAGQGSQELKTNILAHLIRQVDPISSRYLVRIPVATMRLGFSDMTILDGFSWMITGDKSLRSIIEKAYHVRPDLGFIGRVIKEKGIKGLDGVKPKIFTPIIMMRAERLSSGKEIIEQIGRCAIESKYDGFRLQIHYQNNQVKLYSRNLEDASFMYPDLVEAIKKEIKAKEIIFEGEAIGFDPKTGGFLPFQETVQRKRKYDIKAKAMEIPLKLFAFELLYLNGKDYINLPHKQRREALETVIEKTKTIDTQTILLAEEIIVEDDKTIELLFDEALSKGLEGIIAKKLDGVYKPGARGWNWIKFKRSYSAKIEDSIDCLVMGYDSGKGKRTSFGIGAFLVGIYDKKNDKYLTMAKIGTGLTDEEWREIKKRCDKFEAEKKPALYEVDKLMNVDQWVKPFLVVEIKADEITRSPVHTAGRKMKPSKSGSAVDVDIPGLALRFPRLLKFRDDKRPEDVTTLDEVQKMLKAQVV